jgi:4-carboxymuconolactone decarboxylase
VSAPRLPAAGRIPALDPDSLDPPELELLEQLMAGRGRVPTPFRVWLASPELARLLAPLGQFLASATSLSKPEAELVILIGARRLGTRYVAIAHRREALEAGLSERVVTAIEARENPGLSDPRQRAVVDMTLALIGDDPPSDDVFESAAAALGHNGVAEVIALYGYFTAVGLAMKMYAVPPPKGPPRTS